MADGLTEDKVSELAEALAADKNLAKLGRKLGFRESKINLYKDTNKRNDSSEGTCSMLFDWKRKTPKAKQIPDLVKALKESDLAELVDEFFPEKAESPVQGQKESPSTSASNVDSTSSVDVDFDDIMKNIAQEIYLDTEVHALGKALGRLPADIGRCIEANAKQGGNYMGTLNMLRTWQNRQTETTERTALREALMKAGFERLAKKYLP